MWSCPDITKKVRTCRSSMRTFRIQRHITRVPPSQSPGKKAGGKDQWQVFWLAIHPPGAFPVCRPVTYALRPRLQRRVRGGMAPSERHPSSLSSPCGHLDPLFNCHKNRHAVRCWNTTPPASCQGGLKTVILATATSTQDSGLLDVLVPLFEKESGYQVKTIAAGSGRAMKKGEKWVGRRAAGAFSGCREEVYG